MTNENNNNTNHNEPNYSQANDRMTFMTDMDKCMNFLEEKGYTDQFRVEKKNLVSLKDSKKKYKPKDVNAVNFYRFEGISDPDDMSILYAIETCDGTKGTLVDAYGHYSDDDTGAFMQEVDISKKVSAIWEG
ncbi:MAG TPA: hypothetical protein VGE66_19540 [Chitinophagaceae bacterium]